ncbi:GNAT family N-acetyltransferase [Flavobacterium sp. MDT1-60]|uniref:GNAT family N-acetyltransferase n=1 Tax=Flavobacterium sp. MDT1-60 TaxID=1979344 RepID=UPI001784E97A|nr:GNAT family protein [Flavobacterium sp. MDT1-60]QOG01164.1 GNAT family N-acetyltransferase [Flavobacterium sp. MDT1-60]
MKLPPYDKFPEINSDTIILRQVETNDINDLVEISFYDSRPALTFNDALEMQERINLDYQNGNSIHWGIANKLTNKIMGTLGYYRGFDEGIGELGCVLKPEFQGQGFMTIAMKLVTEFGLTNIGLTKIIAITSKQNEEAIKLLERVSFIKTADLENDEIEYLFVNNLR